MKKLRVGWILLFFLTNCNSGGSDQYIIDSTIFYSLKKKIDKTEDEIKTKKQAREKKGDTVAIKPQTLAKTLPKEIFGYQAEGKSEATPFELSGQNHASIEQFYQKGDNHLHISVMDHNGKNSPHATLLSLWHEGIIDQNRQEVSSGVWVQKKYKAWAYFDKRRKKAELTVLVSDRISIVVLADNQPDIQLTVAVANKLNISDLSER
jgi:hypothetical protein